MTQTMLKLTSPAEQNLTRAQIEQEHELREQSMKKYYPMMLKNGFRVIDERAVIAMAMNVKGINFMPACAIARKIKTTFGNRPVDNVIIELAIETYSTTLGCNKGY